MNRRDPLDFGTIAADALLEVFETPVCTTLVFSNAELLYRVHLSTEPVDRLLVQIEREYGQRWQTLRRPETLAAKQIQVHLSGESIPDYSPILLNPAVGTDFRRRVWEVARSVPYGETRSYRWLAEQAGSPRAYRAAGQAMAKNPFALVVPCHRIVASDGLLGGFAGGLKLKKALLALELPLHERRASVIRAAP